MLETLHGWVGWGTSWPTKRQRDLETVNLSWVEIRQKVTNERAERECKRQSMK